MKYFVTLIFFISFFSFAQSDLTVVAVGEAELDTDKLMVFAPKAEGKSADLAKEALDIVRNDFSFYKNSFTILKSSDHGFDLTPEDYAKEKYAYVLLTLAESTSQGVTLKTKIYNVRSKTDVANVKVDISRANLRGSAHELSSQIYTAITGKTGIFKAKIAFVSDKGSRPPRRYFKELYTMDFDGSNIKKHTSFGGIVISPSFNHDNTKIVFSLISKNKSERNIGLYILDLRSGDYKLISNQKGINSGAVFSPEGNSLLTTLSFSGNSEIYRMDLDGKNLTKVTNNSADDVDPSLSRDGKKMSFLSDRSGKAMIYIADPAATEKNVERISFIGKFNATPSFSPDGSSIVFSSWDRTFDIYRIGADKTGLFRLTKDFGSNEDPNYSPDGEFIIFTSKRVQSRSKADQDIYIMDKNGDVIGGLTADFGACTTPRWSK